MTPGQDGARPLEGILVLDLTRVLAGPFCTQQLLDLGARVVKIERPGTGDDARAIGPFVGDRSAYFMSLNRGKESLALDLRDAADREVFDALLARADVLVENFRPGAMERLGYGWEALRARHPRLIYASASGFGADGPYRERPAYDLVVQAMGGIMSLTGEPGGAPTRVGTSIGDLAAGLFTALGVVAALHRRDRDGCGARIDVAMLDCQVALLENALARYQASGEVPGPIGSRHPSITPFQTYRAADGHLAIAAGNDDLFARLAQTLGREDWTRDPRYATNDARTTHADALESEIETALATHDVGHWLETLQRAGVPCGPLQNVREVLDDPQVRARNMVVPVEGEAAAGLRVAGNPIKSPDWPDPATRASPPDLDADRERILRELGLDPER